MDLLTFIENSPTAYQAVGESAKILEQNGYLPITERDLGNQQMKPGGKYFVIRNDSSLIAVSMPKEKVKGFHIVASHCDSPAFKIKENPDITVENNYRKLNVEKYGGMILSTWLDRPLGVAGRVIVKSGEKPKTRLLDLKRDYCVIPNLAIHFNREINKGYEYNPQIDMLPLFAGNPQKSLVDEVAKELGVEKEEILDYDLFLYNREKGRLFGCDNEFILSPRLDDLQCVYASLQAMIGVKPKEYVPVCAIFDNEEVGSRTRQGADSDFLRNILQKVVRGYGADEELTGILAESFLLSADNAHALHPNHPEKSDLTNKPYLNKGIVLKYNGDARYTTDAYSAAVVRELCKEAGIPLQIFANRSDIAGGSTLGNLLVSQVSVPAADVGLAQLAMHSAMETAGAHDMEDMINMMTLFLSK
ncbi:MAG: M18 family aminopeptidase [Lachnospiraceae bacterium]|nr:M18 family aminopeptidase [Lachnospiraceae bacterium]